MILALIAFLIGVAVGSIIRSKITKKLANDAHDILNEVEAKLKPLPSNEFVNKLVSAKEVILITKDKDGLFYCSANCSEATMNAFCPSVKSYFDMTDDAVKLSNQIIKKSKQ